MITKGGKMMLEFTSCLQCSVAVVVVFRTCVPLQGAPGFRLWLENGHRARQFSLYILCQAWLGQSQWEFHEEFYDIKYFYFC